MGTTDSDLDRLSSLSTRTGAMRLVVLGDCYHPRASMTKAALAPFRCWHDEHAGLEIHLICAHPGRDAGMSPPNLRIIEHDKPTNRGPFRFQHDSEERSGSKGGKTAPDSGTWSVATCIPDWSCEQAVSVSVCHTST